MSLKDLLPEGAYDEIRAQLANAGETEGLKTLSNDTVMVECPSCRRRIVYDSKNPFRPFCSERCKLIDLGAWASNERYIKGPSINEDEDAGEAESENFLPHQSS